MTKEITKARILQEIQDKFKLRELTPDVFHFLEGVRPVYDISPHLLKPERVDYTLPITGTGPRTFFVVPESERWMLHRYAVIFITGVFTVAGCFIGRPDASNYIYLDLTAGQNISYINDLPKDAVLRPGDTFDANIDGYTSTGNLRLIIDVTKEEIR